MKDVRQVRILKNGGDALLASQARGSPRASYHDAHEDQEEVMRAWGDIAGAELDG